MAQSTLRQVLTIFETADAPLSLPHIARKLDVSREQLEGMIQHWVRKGKIRESHSQTECGGCGHKGACPFVLDLPRSYELIAGQDAIPLNEICVTSKQQRSGCC